MLLGKMWDDVCAEDLEQLVTDSYEEGLLVDFNRAFPSKKSQKESVVQGSENEAEDWLGICKLALAFANTKGGDILVGVQEEKGKASKIEGIEVEDWERLRQTILQKINNSIDPPLTGIRLFNIPLHSKKSVIIIEIPFSMKAPHAVRISTGIQIFLKRVEASVQEMSVEEVREIMLKRYGWEEKAESFRVKRINLAFSEDAGPFALPTPAFFFHLLPVAPRDRTLDFGSKSVRYDFVSAVKQFEEAQKGGLFHWPEKMCFEGLLFRRELPDKYIQHLLITRNGEVEFAGNYSDFSDSSLTSQVAWEKIGLDLLAHILIKLANYGIQVSYLLSYSVLGVKNCRLRLSTHYPMVADLATKEGLSRNRYDLPAMMIESLPAPLDVLTLSAHLKEMYQPLFDMIWNDVNKEMSPNTAVSKSN